MNAWKPAKKDVLDAIAAEITNLYGNGRVVIAIDGMAGSGTTHFAADLAQTLRVSGHSVFQAAIDDFQRSRAERHARKADSPEGFYTDSFDYSTFRRILIEPFALGGSTAFVTAAFDHRRDSPIAAKWRSGPRDAILIVDGLFLNRPGLAGLWNYSIWLDADREMVEQSVLDRDGETPNQELLRDGQMLYLTEASPRTAASAIIDNSDVEHPRRVFADSC